MERPKITPEQVAQAASTPQARQQAYKNALSFLGSTEHDKAPVPYPFKKVNSLCWAISLGIMPECANIEAFDMSLFPEVAKHAPVTKGWWFKNGDEGCESRKAILLQAIEETENEQQ